MVAVLIRVDGPDLTGEPIEFAPGPVGGPWVPGEWVGGWDPFRRYTLALAPASVARAGEVWCRIPMVGLWRVA